MVHLEYQSIFYFCIVLKYNEISDMNGFMASVSQWTWSWINSGDSGGQRRLESYSPYSCKESGMT